AIAHLEGGPVQEVDPLALGVPGTEGDGWQVVLRTPPIGGDYQGGPLTLKDSMGLLFLREPA
ncbi:MAG: hypothetical protein AAF968_09215, partial [Pseudomonadota bacterium]